MDTNARADEVSQSRRDTYALLARLFRTEVDPELFEMLRGSEVFSTDDEAFSASLSLMRGYFDAPEASPLDLARDYAKGFCGAGSTKKQAAYPFESVYTSSEGLLMQEARDGALAWYRRFGLSKGEGWSDCEDHVALELEFVSYLIGEAMEAEERGDAARVRELEEAQRGFVAEHLANWLPLFVKDAGRKLRTDFYRGLAKFANSYVKRDLAAMRERAA